MAPFARLFPPVAVGRRSYSFFSSKSGGGRFFNPPKAPKVINSATTTTRSTQQTTNTSKHQTTTGDPAITASNAEHTDGSEQIAQSAKPARLDTPECETPSTAANPSSTLNPSHLSHPMLKPHEFKLHNFFALHRPCLLLNQPTSALFESAQTAAPSAPAVDTIDNPPEASADADADAARQLSRALVINRVGGMVDWEAALQRLGTSILDSAVPAESSAGVELDSTKRKRRRKMKKHKCVHVDVAKCT